MCLKTNKDRETHLADIILLILERRTLLCLMLNSIYSSAALAELAALSSELYWRASSPGLPDSLLYCR
jgi:hypothetical protein